MTEKHPLVTDELIAKLDARAEREKAIRNATGSLTLAELQRVTPEQIRALPELIAALKAMTVGVKLEKPGHWFGELKFDSEAIIRALQALNKAEGK